MTEPQPKRPPGTQATSDSGADAPLGAAGEEPARLPRASADNDDERETPVGPGARKDAPGAPISVRVSGRTDVGLVREHNEDNYLLADLESGERDPQKFTRVPPAGLLLGVCDGMGGAAAGEVASQMAVDTILEMMSRSVPAADRDALARALVHSIEEAGERIFEAARTDRSRRGMGTTATIAVLMDKTLFVGQVGDSRAYILRGGELKQITKDQSLVNQLIEAGQLTEDEAEAFEHSNIILQALGTTEQVSVDLTFLELRAGDRLMMCSDGLSGLVHGEVIRDVMREYDDLEACAARLIELAKAGGGHDNVTVILAEFTGPGLAPAQEGDLIGYQQYPLPLENAAKETLDSDVPTVAPPSGRAPPAERVRDSGFVDPDTRPGSMGRAVLFAVLASLVLGAIYWLASSESEEAGENEAPGFDDLAEPAPPIAPAGVEVIVRTDVEAGELFVDGESQGAAAGGTWVLVLPPGPHKLEARTGGNTVSASTLSVREGVPATVLLSLPEGEDSLAADAAPPEKAAKKDAAESRRERRRRERELGEGPATSGADAAAPKTRDAVSPATQPTSKPVDPSGGALSKPSSTEAKPSTSSEKPRSAEPKPSAPDAKPRSGEASAL